MKNILVEKVNLWSQELYQNIYQLRELTGAEQLSNMYNGSIFKIQEMSDRYTQELLSSAISKLTGMLKKKEDVLANLQSQVEEEFVAQEPLELDECYIRAKAIRLLPPIVTENDTQLIKCNESQYFPLQPNPLFKNFYVNMNISAAHVPTNVYDLSKEIRAVGNWTYHLDDVFRKNFEIDPSLTWQYFCSSSGFFKFFPGAMWKVQLAELKLDFFDCRSTPWYVEAASYPMEMVIIVDKSGSMKGRRNTICNATIVELLNTLTQDDFFNVIYFSELIKYAEPLASDRLIQATGPNKDRIIHSFEKHAPNGTANFQAALKAAFGILNATNNKTKITRCNKAIMIITDGAPDDFAEVFDEYNPDRSVRVFTYLLGQHSSDETIVKRIACNNRGVSTSIANLADVKENVLKYLDVVARSNAILNDSFVHWSGISELQLNIMELNPENFTVPAVPTVNVTIPDQVADKIDVPQMDSPENAKPKRKLVFEKVNVKGRDFYISLSRAVYNKTVDSVLNNRGILLGVVGVDVPMQDIQDELRDWKLGPLSYSFGVNNNGFLLFHPSYRPMHGSQLKNYYQNVDIDEVEQPLDFVLDETTALPSYNSTLRTMLIDRQKGATIFESLDNWEDFLTALPITRKVFTAPLPGTPFLFGFAVRWIPNSVRGYSIPKYDTGGFQRNWNLKGVNMRILNPRFTNSAANSCDADVSLSYGTLLSPIKFCKFGRELLQVYLDDPICALKHVILDKKLRIENECDEEQIAQLYVDAKATTAIYNHWRKQESHPLIKKLGIQQAFSMSQPGLIRYFNYSTPAYPEFFDEHEGGVNDPIYKSTLLQATYYDQIKMLVFQPPCKRIFRALMEDDIDVPMVVSSVVSHPKSETVVMGVVGLQIGYKALANLFNSIVNNCKDGVNGDDCLQCNATGVQCFLTTQTGQILVSTAGEKAVSQNLKELDCALMEALVGASVMIEHEIYDFQAICIETNLGISGVANRLLSPITMVFRWMSWILMEFILFMTNTPFTDLWNYAEAQMSGTWDALSREEFEEYGSVPSRDKLPQSRNFELPDRVESGGGRFVYPQRGEELDFGFGDHQQLRAENPDSNLPPEFYGNYESLDPSTETTKMTRTVSEQHPALPSSSSSSAAGAAKESFRLSEFPTLIENAQFFSQKAYVFEDSDDPWQMQQQAFAELNICYNNEPTLTPRKPTPSVDDGLNGSTTPQSDVVTVEISGFNPTTTENIQLVGISGFNSSDANVNQTERLGNEKIKPITRPPVVPGSLLRCVQRVVQMRCHAAAHSDNPIGRQSCEVMCDAVRHRMSQLIEFLHDCRQPLDACTQRHSIFYLSKGAITDNKKGGSGPAWSGQRPPKPNNARPRGGSSQLPKHALPKIQSGSYCPNCGTAEWVVSSIPNTNLLLILSSRGSGKPTNNCNCDCKRRYRYGAQIKGDENIPRPQGYRTDPVTPSTCIMISNKIENATGCESLSGCFRAAVSSLLLSFTLILQLL